MKFLLQYQLSVGWQEHQQNKFSKWLIIAHPWNVISRVSTAHDGIYNREAKVRHVYVLYATVTNSHYIYSLVLQFFTVVNSYPTNISLSVKLSEVEA